MRVLPEGLQAHLAGGATTLCRCWRLSRVDGVVLGFTDHDRDLGFEGVVFSAVDGLEASGDVARTGLGVGGFEIDGAFSSAAIALEDLQSGRYDGATVTLWLVNWADVSERVVLREGTLGEVTRADGAFRAEVRGPMQALETVRGRVVTVACDADLGDGRCKVALAALQDEATVDVVDGARLALSGIDGRPAGWFAGGVCVVLDGVEAGARRLVVSHTVESAARTVVLREPLVGLAAGDRVRLSPGCDKQFATCRKKFANAVNFQGFPFLPGNDRLFAYPRVGP
ncbi:MAG: DUF2163 domain-containing protein [Acuticoccus sp.]